MSTTTENGMGGPRSTGREKTYKKVKDIAFLHNNSLTVLGFICLLRQCEPVPLHYSYFGMLLFRANKSKRSSLVSLSHMSPYKCPSTAHNVLTPARAGCQRSVKCWSHLFSFFLFFFFSLQTSLLLAAFLKMPPLQGSLQWLFRLGLKKQSKVFLWQLLTQQEYQYVYVPDCFGFYCISMEITAQDCTLHKSWILMPQCMICFPNFEDIYHSLHCENNL